VLLETVKETPADFPCKFAIDIAPVGTPAKVRTAALFNEICAVELSPSSVFTWDIDICPLGKGIFLPLFQNVYLSF